MYPPRSQKKRTGSKNRKKKQRRLWLTLNACLLLMIVILLATYFLTENRGAAGVPPQQPSSANTERNETAAKNNGTAPDSDTGSKKDEPEAEASDPAKEQPAEKPDKPGTAQSQTQQTGETQENDGQKQPPQQTKDNPPADAADQGDAGKDAGAEDSEATKEHSIMKDDGKSVTIQFVGDMIFSGKVETLLEKNGYSYPFHYLGDMFKKDDLTLGNLETPVTTGGVSAQNKQFVFKSSPQALEALRAAGMDVVNLGNNHILDQGEVGLLDTINYLDQSGIQYVGAGKDADRAYKPVYFERGGMKIAVIGASRVYPETNWAAGTNKPGVASAYDKASRVIATIGEARKKADLVIVMVHWGIERALTPNDIQKKLGHDFIDAGADLIIGGHPHVLQGLEQYKGKWIAYSTGNFIFTKSGTPSTWKTAVFQATCKKSGCSMKLVPFHAELGQPVPMNAQEGSQLMKELQNLSIGGVKISGDGVVTPGS
ncbi:CapA family protein [Paenibacillus sp. VCA1]|uniref:CapA family protein n=1 Tax=Paenibacillus sp. VCA1 TaxID=3039148 RepID=UPI0028727CC4|nr:CapA family protein [Paenibacillus sp. VCA1]MDR9857421.1 CapA family protein [Paenibacillus sp. VCA1]